MAEQGTHFPSKAEKLFLAAHEKRIAETKPAPIETEST